MSLITENNFVTQLIFSASCYCATNTVNRDGLLLNAKYSFNRINEYNFAMSTD